MELSVFSWIVIFGLLALIVNSIGIFIVYKNKELAEKANTYFMCFAAGLLITVPLVLVFPEAVEKNSAAGSAALVGFLFMFLSNRIIQHKTRQTTLA
ncbi:MAG TPA: zinc/iron permease, partial [Atribacterota bacterium]|nr:zinc/iron permease [Atribacterota bacterium]